VRGRLDPVCDDPADEVFIVPAVYLLERWTLAGRCLLVVVVVLLRPAASARVALASECGGWLGA
jgi:hypothetical protein